MLMLWLSLQFLHTHIIVETNKLIANHFTKNKYLPHHDYFRNELSNIPDIRSTLQYVHVHSERSMVARVVYFNFLQGQDD